MHQGRGVWGEKKLYTYDMDEFDKKLKTLLNKIMYSWKSQGWYLRRLDTAPNEIKQLFIANGWTPPPERPAEPQEDTPDRSDVVD